MKLEAQMRQRIRTQGKSKETFKTYWFWCDKFIRFLKDKNGKWVHPNQVGELEAEEWLTHLANKEFVSSNTQNVALQALCYLYRHILDRPLENVNAMRSKRGMTCRDVLSVSEVAKLLDHLSGYGLLVAQLIYGCGLRISDVVNLRVKDISFERCQLHIHSGKGDKSRFTSFPEVLHDPVRQQLKETRRLWNFDQAANNNGVSLFGAYRRKHPSAAKQYGYYYLFCSKGLSKDEAGVLCRHHKHKSHLGRQISQAARQAEIHKKVTSHILRHSYATHANEQGVGMRKLQVLLGHHDIRTTEGYVHANKHEVTASHSPLERLKHQLENPRQQRRQNMRIG